MTDNAAGVEVRVTGEGEAARAGFSGLQSCGSVWACPVCAEKVNARRQVELEHAMDTWAGRGGHMVFGTFTLSHSRSHALTELWDALALAWTATISGKGWHGGRDQVGDAERFGLAGWVRVVECKVGEHGWHPHVHAVFFTRTELDDDQLEELRSRLYGRWSAYLGSRGFRSLDFDVKGHAVGVDLRRVVAAEYLADYLAKHGYRPAATPARGAAYEITGSQSKVATKGGRTPFQVLADVVMRRDELVDQDSGELVDRVTGELRDVDDQVRTDLRLWREWEAGSAGRRQITWSRSIRLELQLEEEVTDQEVVETDELEGDAVAVVPAAEWRERGFAYVREELLERAELGTLSAWLADLRSGPRWARGSAPPATRETSPAAAAG